MHPSDPTATDRVLEEAMDAGTVVATRKGEAVDPLTARGPIRIGRADPS